MGEKPGTGRDPDPEGVGVVEAPDGMSWIPGGAFVMGSEIYYPEEKPAHDVRVDGFWMDRHTVTNEAFARFAADTGYETVAERPLDPEDFPGAPEENLQPGSMLFRKTDGPVDLEDYSNWWCWQPGTSWRHPLGPGSSLDGLEHHPVVHVAFEDAEAYARWAGKELPTEAEWEYAARGGLDGKNFVWGDEDLAGGGEVANTWQGEFPWQNLATDGYEGTAPVGSYPANGYGLFDMAGNVWEWTDDWYTPSRKQDVLPSCCGVAVNPRISNSKKSLNPLQPMFSIPRKVVKGGSFLCAPNYCLRYRPAARQPQMIDTGMSHVGFRCVLRAADRDAGGNHKS
jgi:formylglycine-generating enzyme required for sulfatase activity